MSLIISGTTSTGVSLVGSGDSTGTIVGQGLTDGVNDPRTLVWTGAQGTGFATAGNWADRTAPADPATAAPGLIDTAEFLAAGGVVTGTGTADVLQFGNSGQWSLGSGAALTAETGITAGNGMLSVGGGASIASAGSVDVISGTGDPGASVAVSGTDAAWTSAGDLIVGDAGPGSLAIQADGTVVSNAGTIANQSGAGGSEVNVTGAGSGWQIGGTLVVGNTASGTLDVSAGATVTAASLDEAAQAGGDGVIVVTGTGSSLDVSGSLTVGANWAGELLILGGATVSALDVTIGSTSTVSSGNVDIEGAGSELRIATGGMLNVGASGALTVGQGATLQYAGTITETAGASINNNGGVIDPDAVEYTTSSNGGGGENDYSLYVGNTGQVQINNGTGTYTTPMMLSGSSVAQATTNIDNNFNNNGIYGGVGLWQIGQGGTLIINANTIDIGQAIVFQDTMNDALVIGQVVNGGSAGISNVPPTIAAGAENLLQAGGFAAQIWDYQTGDQILFNNLTLTSDTIVNSNTLELFNNSGSVGSLTFFSKSGLPNHADALAAQAQIQVCFCANTLIQTPSGQVQVQDLAVGDMVTTYRGDARCIVWIGAGKVLATRGRRTAATPVIVRKGALDDNVPARDLRVTKGHSLYVDDVLIPVEFLVNHRSILWDDRARVVEIFHIELETHDVLLANGAPAESYRDDGNRWLFQNGNSGWDLPPKALRAPVLTGGPVVDAVWRRLLERAGRRPGLPLTGEPDLHLVVDGVRIDAIERRDDIHVFRLPGRPGSVRIGSRAAVPQELGIARDARQLGVAVRRIVLQEQRGRQTVEADAASLSDGYHPFESDSRIRWTDGDAAVPAALFARMSGPGMLMLHLGGATQYRDEGTAAQAA